MRKTLKCAMKKRHAKRDALKKRFIIRLFSDMSCTDFTEKDKVNL